MDVKREHIHKQRSDAVAPIFHDRQFTVSVTPDEVTQLSVQVYYRDDCRQVAVVTPPPDAQFRLAQVIDAIANRLNALGYEFDYLIEHFPARPLGMAGTDPESFDLVCFRWDAETRRYHAVAAGPNWPWQHLCRDEAEAIIGEPFEDGVTSAAVSSAAG